MISASSLIYAGTALISALYVHFMFIAGRLLRRKFHIPTEGWATFPFFVLMLALLYVEAFLLNRYLPNQLSALETATFIGLAIGRIMPQPGNTSFFGFGSDSDSDFPDDTGDSSDDGGDGGGH